MTAARFRIEKDQAWTDCECPASLCTHENGQRLYDFWLVIDTQDDDAVPEDFDTHAEAQRALKRAVEEVRP